MSIQMPVKVQRWGGAFQVENISDPSVKQELFGWMATYELGPQSNWRFSVSLDSKKIGVLRSAYMTASKRPGPARSGYLCFYPPMKVAIFVEDAERRGPDQEPRPPRTAILRMRHSPLVYNSGGAIFAATLAISDSTLWLEDVLMAEGRNIWNDHTFSKRWQKLKSWFVQDWSEDLTLQRGLSIKPRQIVALDAFKSEPGDVWEFIPEDAQRRRFIWKDRRLNTVVLSSYPQKPQPKKEPLHRGPRPVVEEKPAVAAEPVKVGILDTYFPSLPSANDGSLIAVAKKDLSGPDVYALYSSDGKSLGIAVIRKMMISLEMRKHTADIRVRVVWNSSFDRWEIVDVNVSAAASASTAFKKTDG
jgi:hypothetical protein